MFSGNKFMLLHLNQQEIIKKCANLKWFQITYLFIPEFWHFPTTFILAFFSFRMMRVTHAVFDT